MQDIHLATAVALYKAPMRHRPASYEPVMPTPYTLSTALLELLTDFNSTHLMVQFPFAHYHYSLSILHLILIYHKKCRIRLKSWRPLFNSLASLINFLTQTAPKVQPASGVFRLVARVLLVLNFFITYGDTFLPDAAAYDSLYYEISRQDSIFLKLATLIEEAKSNPIFEGSDEYLTKVSNQLLNILSIIEHVRPKLEVLARSYPTEEQVIAIVQECFNGLTLKLYDGLEVVEHFEEPDDEAALTTLTEKITLQNGPHWAELLDYRAIAEDLSAIE
uniref:DUF1741 domain-containing protein n=1 Tax=Panagrellus redivivus TaxID=6233 RepID=A0A7E4ULY1_PANRE